MDIKKKLHAGVIGCGFIAQTQWLYYLHELDEFEMAALCDASKELVDYYGDYYGVKKRYTDWRLLLEDKEIDAVIVLTKCHEEICIAAAANKKHVLVEKPLCENLEQACRIEEAVNTSGVILMVGEMKRYDPGFQYAMQCFQNMKDIWMIRARDFSDGLQRSYGQIYPVRFAADIPDEVKEKTAAEFEKGLRGVTKELPGNLYETLLMCGVHNIELMRASFGEPKKILHCDIWNEGETLSCEMDYGDKCRAFFEVGLTNYKWFDEEITVYGDEKAVTVRFPNPLLKNAVTEVIVKENSDGAVVEKRIEASYSEAFKNELIHFYQCVTEHKKPWTSIEEGKTDIKIMQEIFSSYAERIRG
ncbi:hypothetical protein GPL15_10185 [Clostridium sp. MCC353]|uniref:Gfo/Idh/MocA family protein n=1 Tax=Clostridium sp. MCC353 TaxID=2592646 RepID=UPI001C02E327|nr:Gfo/Idh/MocA family oxidoreductase [Clostridium sp. MCC353]MBT9776872.1 hypothetical protein [Clostridium sp. MCC353]